VNETWILILQFEYDCVSALIGYNETAHCSDVTAFSNSPSPSSPSSSFSSVSSDHGDGNWIGDSIEKKKKKSEWNLAAGAK